MKKMLVFWRIGIAILLTLSACNLPGGSTGGTPLPKPESLPPMPPAIVETSPAAGSQLPLQTSIIFYFNQPMNRDTVNTALTTDPAVAGVLTWTDDSIAVFTPAASLPVGSELTFKLDESIRSKNGQAPAAPISLSFHTADRLSLLQTLPENASNDVTATSAVVASFNQPVVALGADSATLPAAFTLDPVASGKGEWLNTSTYIFYPDPALAGGVQYTAHLNTSLTAISGSSMDNSGDWSFNVAKPRLLSMEPSETDLLSLDAALTLTFNQPMEPASVQQGLSFTGPSGVVNGKITWDQNNSVMTFTPDALLGRDSSYVMRLSAQVQGRGGTPMGSEVSKNLHTYPNFRVVSSDPSRGEVSSSYVNPVIEMSAPIQEQDASNLVTISPEVPNVFVRQEGVKLFIYADFSPQTAYTINVDGGLKDAWGQALGQRYSLHFTTGAASPTLAVPYVGADAYFVRADAPDFYVQAVNIPTVDLALGPVPLGDFLSLNASGAWQARNAYVPEGTTYWQQTIQHATANVSAPVKIQLPAGGGSLTPGIYNLLATSGYADYNPGPMFIVASNVNLTLKTGARDVLVWAVDLRTNTPVGNAPVSLYSSDGNQMASGVTDAQGVWKAPVTISDPYSEVYAIMGLPGDAYFSMAGTRWDQDITPWSFGLTQSIQGEHTDIYLYTDRPIYRPGQTVYFRAVVRQTFDGQYTAANMTSLPLTISDGYGQTWPFDLPLSSFGTAHGEFKIPEDVQPGSFTIQNNDLGVYFDFSVADYRKPEINLSVTMTSPEIQSGAGLQAGVDARYFFDAPSGGLPVEWTLYAQNDYFYLPEYHVGTFVDSWLNPENSFQDYGEFGQQIASGKGVTGPDGKLSINIPAAKLPEVQNRTTLTLEVTGQDESGQPVSARTTAMLHPAETYIGIRPDVWVGQAGSAMGFGILSVDWSGNPAGVHPMHATFSSVTWERKDTVSSFGDRYYTFTPVFTEISSTDISTAADGSARLQFTPPHSGTYLLDITSGGARSQSLLWVGGTSQAIWPNLPHNQVRLTADRDTYQSGQTASIFIPNPLGSTTLALVSVERGTIHSTQVLNLGPSGSVFTLPLTDQDAPNIYVSATLIGVGMFSQGFINLVVENPKRILNVELTSTPQRAGPGDPVTFDLKVTDSNGQPVQGEFSLAVVDLAALALADPNSLQIVQQYTQKEPLGINTALSLAADPLRGIYLVGGRGGGGGGAPVTVARENFPDTAYWKADIVTDANGKASVSMNLPDNLTTWQVDVRGLTQDMRIGQAESQIVATKSLLVRPVTPVFMVAGDHVQVGAVVHNNTNAKMEVKVTLQTVNFNLDKDPKQTQKVSIPAGGRTLVTWWGTAQDGDSAELTFSAQAGSLNDASLPTNGPIPIIHYISPRTYSTAGVLSSSGSRLEAVSLPRSFDPSGGGLTVELSPSMAASILSGLDTLEDPPTTASNEYLASYLLPNIEVYRALQAAGLEDAALKARAQTKLQGVMNRLVYHQNYNDGGWTWYTFTSNMWDYTPPESDPYLSAYILLGLYHAKQAGFDVRDDTLQQARDFLTTTLGNEPGLDINVRTFIVFVLQETGGNGGDYTGSLLMQRGLLEPWAQALLALVLDGNSPNDPNADQLITDLETTAIRSATGAYWESDNHDWNHPASTLVTTAMVAYALARRDPASPLLADAARYLSLQRSAAGTWGSSYETSWITLALNAYMVGTGGYAANYSFDATLNSQPMALGQASGPSSLTPVVSTVPITGLLPDYPNALAINRGDGTGSLFYRVALQVFQSVEKVQALDEGLSIERNFYPGDCGKECQPVHSVQLGQDARLTVSLTLTLPHDAYYLMVQDTIPAGAEILNTSLKTSQQGEGSGTSVEVYDPENPYANGWGWWYFSDPIIHDDHITWSADYLPAGNYVLSYTLIPMNAGTFRVIPAHAWLNFFPELQGTTAGELFEIKP